MDRRAASALVRRARAHSLEYFAEKILHRLPRAMVRCLIIGQRGDMVSVGVGIGEAVPGAAVDVELPVGPGRTHLILERLDLRRRYKRIVGSVAGQNSGLHLARFGRILGVVVAMKTDHAVNRCAAAREVQHGASAEAVSDRGGPAWVDAWIAFELR